MTTEFKELSICAWNMHGLSTKLNNPDFFDFVCKFDIIILTETWFSYDINLSFNGYSYKNFIRKKNCKKSNDGNRGGITVLYKEFLEDGIRFIQNSLSDNFVWLELNKNFFNCDKNIYVCGAHIPPYKSPYFKEDFELLEQDICAFDNENHIFILGDLNARTGLLNDFVSDDFNCDHDNDLYAVNEYSSDVHIVRNNLDVVVNNYGRQLIDLCISCGVRILNGRFIGNSLGYFTCYPSSGGCSAVDYALCSCDFLENIYDCTCYPIDYLSDHSPISVTFKCKFSKSNTILYDDVLKPFMKRYKWKNDNKQLYVENVFNDSILKMFANYVTTSYTADNVDTAVDDLCNILYNVCDNSNLGIKKCSRNFAKKKCEWKDDDIKMARKEVKKLGKCIRRYPNNRDYVKQYQLKVKYLNKLFKSKKREHKCALQKKIQNVPNKQNAWKEINDIFKSENKSNNIKNTEINCHPTTLVNHFKRQGNVCNVDSNFEQEVNDNIVNMEKKLSYNDITDKPITCKEVRNSIKKLKNGKSSGFDNIFNEMLKYCGECIIQPLCNLFNVILSTGVYPKSWASAIIITLYKGKGNKSDPNNYRGLSITSNIAKLFSNILNTRLSIFLEPSLNSSQFGFRKNFRTSDNIFVLKTIMNKYVHMDKKKVYVAFIDLRKAFDSVWRNGLLYKLIKKGVGCKIYFLLKSIYANCNSCIKINDKVTDYFDINRGIKQGDNLSPLLFNVFIDDLPSIFDNDCAPLKIHDTSINCLLYADDMVLFSETKEGLQNCLNSLYSYCKTWQLEINTDKTKTMTFHNGNYKDKLQFHVNNCKLEHVNEYCYLGNVISSNTLSNTCVNNLVNKSKKSYFLLRQKMKSIDNLSPQLHVFLFDLLCRPIVTYCAEIWYCDFSKRIENSKKRSLKNNKIFDELQCINNFPFELLNLKMCKIALQISPRASNTAAKLELGRQPIEQFIKIQSLKYFKRILNLNPNFLVSKCLKVSTQIHNAGVFSWYTYIQQIVNDCKLTNSEISQTSCKKLNIKFTENTSNYYNKLLYDDLNRIESKDQKSLNKLRTYRLFKYECKYENYLDVIINPAQRRIVTKFRLSDHSLEIEKGRHQNILERDRICKLCTLDIENEEHFLLKCNFYSTQRKLLFDKIGHLIPNFVNLSTTDKFIYIVKSNVKIIILALSQYIHNCFKVRNLKLAE